jgi:hypothetical protein
MLRNTRTVILLVVSMIAAGGCDACGKTKLATAIDASAHASSSGPSLDAAGTPAPPRAATPTNEMSLMIGVTRDKTRALIRTEDIRGHRNKNPDRVRWVEIANNRIVEEWALPGYSSLPRESMNDDGSIKGSIAMMARMQSPELMADLVKYGAALATLETVQDERFAVSPKGDRIVFNGGDWLYLADGTTGKVLSRYAAEASYGPHIAPNGKLFAYSRMVGSLDGVVGNYVLWLAPLEANAPSRRVMGTRDVGSSSIRWSPDSTKVYVQMGHEHARGACLARVDVTPPSAVKKVACVGLDEILDQLSISPKVAFAALIARSADGGFGPKRVRVVDLEKEAVIYEAMLPDRAGGGLVSDAPLLVTAKYPGALNVDDVLAKTRREAPFVGSVAIYSLVWTGPRAFVYAYADDGVKTFDLAPQ